MCQSWTVLPERRFDVKKNLLLLVGGPILLVSLWQMGCGSGTVSILNHAFVNTISGGVFPLTPGPRAAFVLVRCLNQTNQNAEFQVTIEREILETDNDGNFRFEADGTPLTKTELERFRILTAAIAPANDVGVLLDCSVSPVKRVGLGEDLLRTDAAVRVGPGNGVGVRVDDLNPLSLDAGNFNCGDTIIFQAFENTGVAGGVSIHSFVLSGVGGPERFSGPNTFANFAAIREVEQRRAEEEEP